MEKKINENLGDILSGDIINITNYTLTIDKNEMCKILCIKKIDHLALKKQLDWCIERDYRFNYYLDNLPSGLNNSYLTGEKSNSISYKGVPLGDITWGEGGVKVNQIYNHLTFNIYLNYNKNEISVIEFNIVPFSINHNYDENSSSVNLLCAFNESSVLQNFNVDKQYSEMNEYIIYTYDIIYHKTDIQWTSRWDHIQNTDDTKFQIISLVNSSLIIFVLTAIIAHLFCKAIRRDIDTFNIFAIGEEFVDDSRWKQVSQDVFRKPRHSMLFSVLVGTGIQLFAMALITLVCAGLGFVSVLHRGSMLNVMLILYVFMAGLSGYISGKIYKLFNEEKWLINGIATCLFYPSTSLIIFSIINFFLYLEGSSGYVPFNSFIQLILLWLCCSSPLVLVGTFTSIKAKKIKNPCKVNIVPNIIPFQPWYLDLKIVCLFSGLFPFG